MSLPVPPAPSPKNPPPAEATDGLRIGPAGGTCLICRWAVPGPRGQLGQRFCRRLPPTVTTFLVPTPDGRASPHSHSAWPLVETTNWCGEFADRQVP